MSAPHGPGGADCGCCAGTGSSETVRTHNPPGLDAVAYRIGTHGTFKRGLLSALSSSRHPTVADLTTRDDDDFSIALLDAFSCVADVLTFYQERFAQEAWLRTADERLSLRELARLIGYGLAPGVAADAWLAFRMEEVPGSPADEVGRSVVPVGTRVQSTPGPDEQPQIYETVEEIEGRVAWNAIRPPRRERHPLTGTSPLYFEGVATGLKVGDGVLHEKDGGGYAFGIVSDTRIRAELEVTEVAVSYLAGAPERGTVSLQASDPALGEPAAEYEGEVWTAADLAAEAEVEGFDPDALLQAFTDNPRPAPRVMVFRTRAAVFGHNAPAWNVLPLPLKVQEKKYAVADDGTVTLVGTVDPPFEETDWIDGKTLADLDSGGDGRVHLDATYPSIGQPGTVVLRQEGTWAIYQVDGVAEITHADFNVSAKVTRLELDDDEDLDAFDARKTTVFGASEVLSLARPEITTSFEADDEGWMELEGWVPGLAAGQRLIVTGPPEDGSDAPVSASCVLEEIEYDLSRQGGTRVKVSPVPAHAWARAEVTINANVAAATHGESVEEVLGSGDARLPFQSFELAQPPLTFVSASTDEGRESTLEVRINDVLWHEVDALYGRGADERVYVTRQTEAGSTVVQFGDGVTGARLPSGTGNVRASYRKGVGLAGRVAGGKLDVLTSRPLGLKSVLNPLAAEGGEDPETLDEARVNAPLTVLTLGRAVSLRDYEDYARTFAGIAKASATWTWTGRRRSVFLTVAAAGGAEVPQGGTLHTALLGALADAGDPNVPLTIASYRKALFRIEATVTVHEDHLDEVVLEAVETALRDRFSFERRGFGQPVALSEVVATIQRVEGVLAVDLDRLYRTDGAAELNALLPADAPATGEEGDVQGAEILFLDPAPLDGVKAAS